jgi:hypothetical protein
MLALHGRQGGGGRAFVGMQRQLRPARSALRLRRLAAAGALEKTI